MRLPEQKLERERCPSLCIERIWLVANVCFCLENKRSTLLREETKIVNTSWSSESIRLWPKQLFLSLLLSYTYVLDSLIHSSKWLRKCSFYYPGSFLAPDHHNPTRSKNNGLAEHSHWEHVLYERDMSDSVYIASSRAMRQGDILAAYMGDDS